jgi:hypothetical protein
VNPGASQSSAGMPKAVSIYGTLPEQLTDPRSFASQLKRILAVRKQYGIAASHQIDIPVTSHPGVLAMLHQLDNDKLQMTVLNFSNEVVTCTISSEYLLPSLACIDMFTGKELPGRISRAAGLKTTLEPHEGKSILFQ